MRSRSALLSKPGIHLLFFILSFIFLGGPLVRIADRTLGAGIFHYLFITWGAIIFLLILVAWSLKKVDRSA